MLLFKKKTSTRTCLINHTDNRCANKTFGLECNNTCNCYEGLETCFVATGGCESGCAEGYQGEGCSKGMSLFYEAK